MEYIDDEIYNLVNKFCKDNRMKNVNEMGKRWLMDEIKKLLIDNADTVNIHTVSGGLTL